MNLKFLTGGGKGGASSKDDKTDQVSELGALKLGADEIAAFEAWIAEPNKPTKFMVEAAKAHKVLRLRQQKR
jgi:hypothetical protein